MTRVRSRAAIALAMVGILGILTGCAGGVRATWHTPTSPDASAPATPPPCEGWDCAIQQNFAATEALITSKPGFLGLVLKDRETGLVWEAGAASRPIWTASAIKLAIATDVLVQARASGKPVSATNRERIDRMLHVSFNGAATQLWGTKQYGGQTALTRYQKVFGMKGIGFPTSERLWGAVKCTAEDFANLMGYILDKMDAADRDYLVEGMRGVHAVQQWGVFGAGEAWQPGNKDGWNVEKTAEGEDGWVANSIGFAGPNERYIVSLMYELPGGTHAKGHTLEAGMQSISDVTATLFGGTVPAKIPSTSLVLNPPTA